METFERERLIDWKLIGPFIVLLLITLYVTLYFQAAYTVAEFVTEGTKLTWNGSPAGSFFPFPTAPGKDTGSPTLSSLDQLIYNYFIKLPLLVLLTLVLWLGMVVYVAFLVYRLRRFI